MRALVTGANGFTGSHLVRLLLDKSYEVRALVREGSSCAEINELPLEYAYADLANSSPVDEALEGVDILFHIAAAYRAENIPRRVFWDVNVGGTKKMLAAAKRAGVKRFVHCSTVGVQGHIKNPPAKEDVPYAPGDYYQESKRAGEVLALEFFKKENLPGTVVRPTGIYGPGDTRFLKLFKAIDTGRFRMIGPGRALYHLTFVEDLVAGISLAGEREQALGQIFTIGGNEYVTLNELVTKIAATLQRSVKKAHIPVWPVWLAGLLCELACRPLRIPPPIYRRRVDFFIKDRAFDVSKAKRLLGYEPRMSLDEGLRITAAWYRKMGLLGSPKGQPDPA